MRQVFRAGFRNKGINVIAADPALHVGKARSNLSRLTPAQFQQRCRNFPISDRKIGGPEIFRNLAELQPTAVGKDGVDDVHIIYHIAVANGPGAAGVVRRHAPYSGP